MLSTIVVVPCFNEAARLDVATYQAFAQAEPTIGFVFVNDGSRDETGAVLNRLAEGFPRQMRVLHLPHNSGKAEAVRQGMLAAFAEGPEAVAYWDADLATPLAAVLQFRGILDRRPQTEIVLGARLPLLGRAIERRPTRAVLGRCFAWCASRVLGLSVRDTQCGAKMFRAGPRTAALFAAPFGTRWIFDVELLARWRSQRRGASEACDQIYEAPIDEWREVAGSKLKRSDFARAAVELLRIGLAYRRPTPPEPVIYSLDEHRGRIAPVRRTTPARRAA